MAVDARDDAAELYAEEGRVLLELALSSPNIGTWSSDFPFHSADLSRTAADLLGVESSTIELKELTDRLSAGKLESLLEKGLSVDLASTASGGIRFQGRSVENGRRYVGTVVSDLAPAHRERPQLQFLLGLNDALRDLENPFSIMDVGAETLGRYLPADLIGYGKIEGDRIVGRQWSSTRQTCAALTYPAGALEGFVADELAAGHTIIIDSVADDPRLTGTMRDYLSAESAAAAIFVPIHKRASLDSVLFAVRENGRLDRAAAALTEDVAKRTWNAVERAQAEINLRESDTRQRIISEALPALVWIIDKNLMLTYANQRWSNFAGLSPENSLGSSWMEHMHPADLARIQSDAPRIVTEECPYAIEARYLRHDGVYRWHMIRAEPVHDTHGAFRGWSGTSIDIHDLKEAEEALRENESQLRIALQAARMGVWRWDRYTDEMELSERAMEIFELPALRGCTWTDLQQRIAEGDRKRAVQRVQHSLDTGEPYDFDYWLHDENMVRHKFIVVQARTTYDESGKANGLVGVVQDISDRKHAEERLHLLIRELHHRVKNTLATVQAIVGSTARTASSIDEFYQGFVGRIVSLARTHNLLTEDLWQKAPLQQLVQTELGPYDDEGRNRISIEGPPVDLPSEAAVPIGMALHELTTNAAKHGALSTFGGQVEVSWSLHEGGEKPLLRFSWTERGGPPVAMPTRQGFGSRLLQRVLATQLQADVHMDFQPEGLRFSMVMPVPVPQTLLNPAM
jgi:PAS domain S-box-containing protein